MHAHFSYDFLDANRKFMFPSQFKDYFKVLEEYQAYRFLLYCKAKKSLYKKVTKVLQARLSFEQAKFFVIQAWLDP